MNPAHDYKSILSSVIQKQMALLGPQITLQRARHVSGIVVGDDGTVSSYNGSPQILMQDLINEFVELSGLIVKKTMEPLIEVEIAQSQIPAQPSPQAAIDQALKGVS